MIHISSIVACVWLYGALNTEAAYRTDIACYPILWITLVCTAPAEEACRAIVAYSTEACFTTELARITAHTVFNSGFTHTWLVCSLRAMHWGWCACGTVTAIWTFGSPNLIQWHLFWRASPTPEPFTTLLGGNYVPCPIAVVAC